MFPDIGQVGTLLSDGTKTDDGSSEGIPDRPDDEVQSVRLTDDCRLAYETYGEPAGFPVVVYHGTPGSRHLGRCFDAHARERGLRIIAPDRPGYGRSDQWTEDGERPVPSLLPTLLDDIDEPVAGLVAFSGGSAPALLAADRHPDRVARLDVVSGAVPPEVAVERPRTPRLLGLLATRAPRLLGASFRAQAWLAGHVGPSVVVDQYTADDRDQAVDDEVATVLLEDFRTAVAGRATGAVAEFAATQSQWRWPDGERTPTCFWHGERDDNVPIENVERFHDRVPGARLERSPSLDHLGTLLERRGDVLDEHARLANP